MNTKFDVFFNLNDEDTYLVQNISQHLRDKGVRTFDRSVDRLPNNSVENLSENDALDSSRMMLYVVTENSFNDPSCLNLLSRAMDNNQRIVMMRFDDALVPGEISVDAVIEASRENLKPALHHLDQIL